LKATMTLALVTNYNRAFNNIELNVLPVRKYVPTASPGVGAPPLPPETLSEEDIPTLTMLFGSFKLCQCEHCRSVYSAAAYMVDLLQFLYKYPAKNPNQSAKDILLKRRPDLAQIHLSCENTKTPVPYVDLVIEILENAIAPMVFLIEGSFIGELTNTVTDDKGASVPQGLISAFEKQGFVISEQARIFPSKDIPDNLWEINDKQWHYQLGVFHDPNIGNLIRVRPYPQTGGTTEELSANPEHVNPKAYDKLANQVFPFTLPFDLWTKEVNLYLEHLGVPRYQLMEAFFKPITGETSLTDEKIATAYLGLTPKEREIITNNSLDNAWDYWGLLENGNVVFDPITKEKVTESNWIGVLGRVSVFLHRTELSYQE
ncbi:MAG: hypothetical protein ACREA4_12240, partial [Nitrososphaera sp.]